MVRHVTLRHMKTLPFYTARFAPSVRKLNDFARAPEKTSGSGSGSGSGMGGVERENGVTENSRVLGERPTNINIMPVLKNVKAIYSTVIF